MQTTPSRQQKVLADAFLLGLGVVLLVISSGGESGRPLEPGFQSFFLGVYILYLGLLFLLSYFHADKSYVLAGFMWVCENFSRPRGRHMAFVAFALSFVLGVWAILAALGVF